jgi:hypothetical protein
MKQKVYARNDTCKDFAAYNVGIRFPAQGVHEIRLCEMHHLDTTK